MDKAQRAELGTAAGTKGRAVYRIVINGSQQAIFDELTSLERPLGAIFNARMAVTEKKRGGRIQMRTVSGRNVIVDGDILEFILKNLKAIVKTGRPPLGTRIMYWAFGKMEFVFPARCRVAQWPIAGRRK